MVITRLRQGRSASRLTHSAGGILFLVEVWTEDLDSSLLLATGFPPALGMWVPCGSSQHSSWLPSERDESQRVRNIFSEVTSHSSCIFFISVKLLNPSCAQGGRMTQGHEFRKAGITGAALEATTYRCVYIHLKLMPGRVCHWGWGIESLYYCQKPNQELDAVLV